MAKIKKVIGLMKDKLDKICLEATELDKKIKILKKIRLT